MEVRKTLGEIRDEQVAQAFEDGRVEGRSQANAQFRAKIAQLEEQVDRARSDRTRLDAIRAYVTQALGASQMMKPVSLVLQKVLALLGDEEERGG